MARTVVFIDTNVLLHYTMFDECDWNALVSSRDTLLALCPTVIRELDRKKFSEASPRTREKAARVIRKIGTLVTNSTPVVLRAGLAVWVTCREPRVDFESMHLDKDVGDDMVLAAALERFDCGAEDRVVIATADLGLRLKASSLGIPTVTPPDDWRMPEEPDEYQRQLRATQAELAALRAATPSLRLTFGQSRTLVEHAVRRRVVPTSDEIERSLNRIRRRHPHNAIDNVPGLNSAVRAVWNEEARRQNSELDRFYDAYQDYLRKTPEMHDEVDRTIMFTFVVENDGTQTAEDVDVILETSMTSGWWRINEPKAMKPPEAPRFRDSMFGTIPRMPDFAPFDIQTSRSNAIGPFANKGKQQMVKFHVERAKPTLNVDLPHVWYKFQSFDVAGSFTIAYTLSAKNMRAPQRGEIHVKVNEH